MSVVDLQNRLTTNWKDFCQNTNSSDSLIYISHSLPLVDGPTSLVLSIGRKCFIHKEAKYYSIPEDGLRLLPFQSILVETEQTLALPNNVFGLITGKGNQIFAGTFVSTGKVDPGFNGTLKVGLYNGSPQPIYLKTGEILCSCFFLHTESNLIAPQKAHSGNYYRIKNLSTFRQRLTLWLKTNTFWLTILLTFIALLGTWGNTIINFIKTFLDYISSKSNQ